MTYVVENTHQSALFPTVAYANHGIDNHGNPVLRYHDQYGKPIPKPANSAHSTIRKLNAEEQAKYNQRHGSSTFGRVMREQNEVHGKDPDKAILLNKAATAKARKKKEAADKAYRAQKRRAKTLDNKKKAQDPNSAKKAAVKGAIGGAIAGAVPGLAGGELVNATDNLFKPTPNAANRIKGAAAGAAIGAATGAGAGYYYRRRLNKLEKVKMKNQGMHKNVGNKIGR